MQAIKFLFSLVVVAIVVAWLTGKGDLSKSHEQNVAAAARPVGSLKPAEKPEAEKKADAALTMAVVGAKQLKQAMRDPDSFKLESALIMDKGTICYQYRARNGFNGLNLGRAVWSADRKRFLTSEQTGFASLWNKECGNHTGTENVATINRML